MQVITNFFIANPERLKVMNTLWQALSFESSMQLSLEYHPSEEKEL